MEKLSINEVVWIIRLKKCRGWCVGLGIAFTLIAITSFPFATRNPGAMATSAFAPFREIGSTAWMVLPSAAIAILLFICAFLITLKTKKY